MEEPVDERTEAEISQCCKCIIIVTISAGVKMASCIFPVVTPTCDHTHM